LPSTSGLTSQLHSMEIQEHLVCAQSDHVEQLNAILNIFHRELRRYPLVYDDRLWSFKLPEVRAPDTFTIINSVKIDNKKIKSIYEEYPVFVHHIISELGWGLETKASTNPHPDFKTGVFLRVKEDQPIRAGTLVGFVPGVYRTQIQDANLDDEFHMMRSNGMNFSMARKILCPNEEGLSVEEFNSLLKEKTCPQKTERSQHIQRPRRDR